MNSKYSLVIQGGGDTITVNGNVDTATVTVDINGDAKSIEIPITDESKRDIVISTNFVAAVGQVICTIMGLAPDSLFQLTRIQELLAATMGESDPEPTVPANTTNKRKEEAN